MANKGGAENDYDVGVKSAHTDSYWISLILYLHLWYLNLMKIFTFELALAQHNLTTE